MGFYEPGCSSVPSGSSGTAGCKKNVVLDVCSFFFFFFTAVLFFINIHAVRKRTDGLETSLQFCCFDAYIRLQLCIGVVL